MPRRKGQSYPKLNHHKPSGRAFVLIPDASGKRKYHYCGKWGSEEAKAEYNRVIARIAASPSRSPLVGTGGIEDITLNELLVQYLKHAETYYVDAAGEPSSMVGRIKIAIRKVVELFGDEPATEFGPKALKVVMDAWVQGGLSRKYVNEQSQIMKRIFRWAVGEEILPSHCFERLRAVEGLRKGRTAAVERPKVKPANRDEVEKVLIHLRPATAAIVRVMVHSGARCGELCAMRAKDIDRTGEVWRYTPETHKGTWRGKQRTIYFGRTCQEVLAPLIDKAGSPEAFVFSPLREEEERNAERSAKRVTPKYPSHMMRNAKKRKAKPKRKPGDQYETSAVRRAITRACASAGVPMFTPHRLRHLAATIIRNECGVDVARAMLGHSLASVTEIYSHEVDKELATQAAKKLG